MLRGVLRGHYYMQSWMKIVSKVPLHQLNLNVTPSFVPLTSINKQIMHQQGGKKWSTPTSSIMAVLNIFSECKMIHIIAFKPQWQFIVIYEMFMTLLLYVSLVKLGCIHFKYIYILCSHRACGSVNLFTTELPFTLCIWIVDYSKLQKQHKKKEWNVFK